MDLPLIFNCSSLWKDDSACDDAQTSRALGSRWLEYGVTGQPGKFPPRPFSRTQSRLRVTDDLSLGTCTDVNWKPFTPTPSEEASWLVFEKGGETKSESLSTFEEEKLELVVQQQLGDEAEGDEVLGVSLDSLSLVLHQDA